MRLGVMHDDKPRVDVQLVDVTSDFEEDEALKLSLDKFTSKNFLFIVPIVIPTIWMILKVTNFIYLKGVIGEKMEEVLGTFTVPLDGRFSSIRTSETNLGNFMCDVMASLKKQTKY